MGAFTVTSLSGAGWTCSLSLLQCTRYDSLPPGGSFPPVTVTFNIPQSPPTSVNSGANVYSPGGQAESDVEFAITRPQTITFLPIPTQGLGAAPFQLNASASSGLPITYSASGGCTITGNIVTLTATGSCTITASQTGNAYYFAATSVMQTFSIPASQPTVSLVATPSASIFGASVTLTATVTPAGATWKVMY